MTLTFAVLIYAAAMTLANLSVATWGPWVSPINAFEAFRAAHPAP